MPSAASYRKPPLIQISPKTSKSSQLAKSLTQPGVGCGTLPDAVLINIVSLSRLATCSGNVLNDDEAFARLPKIISRDRRAKRVGKKREAERSVAEKSAARSLVTSNTERHRGLERQKEEGRAGRMDNMQVTMGEAIRER